MKSSTEITLIKAKGRSRNIGEKRVEEEVGGQMREAEEFTNLHREILKVSGQKS